MTATKEKKTREPITEEEDERRTESDIARHTADAVRMITVEKMGRDLIFHALMISTRGSSHLASYCLQRAEESLKQ